MVVVTDFESIIRFVVEVVRKEDDFLVEGGGFASIDRLAARVEVLLAREGDQ
jgi:hypothetical protein